MDSWAFLPCSFVPNQTSRRFEEKWFFFFRTRRMSLLQHRCTVCCQRGDPLLRGFLARNSGGRTRHPACSRLPRCATVLACNPRHLVCLSRSWPCLQAANAMTMVCHRHLRFQDERLLLTRPWYLIASQRSGVTRKPTNHATSTCWSSVTGTGQDCGFRVSVGFGGAVTGFFRCL